MLKILQYRFVWQITCVEIKSRDRKKRIILDNKPNFKAQSFKEKKKELLTLIIISIYLIESIFNMLVSFKIFAISVQHDENRDKALTK